MNVAQATSEVKSRLEKQLCELGLAADLVDEIVGHSTLLNYNKGSTVFLQGSPADVLFYVFMGMLKVYCPRANGSRIMVKLAGPGDIVGYADYLDSRGRRAQVFEVKALTKSSVALFTRDYVLKLLQSLDHKTQLQVIERLNTAWSAMAQRFGTFLSMSFKERLELELKELGEKFGVRDSRGILIMLELSHSDFADMIGSSRPMVSRLFAEMVKAGLILRRGKQLILLESSTEYIADGSGQLKEPPKNGREAPSPPMARNLTFKLSARQREGQPAIAATLNGKGNSKRVPV